MRLPQGGGHAVPDVGGDPFQQPREQREQARVGLREREGIARSAEAAARVGGAEARENVGQRAVREMQ